MTTLKEGEVSMLRKEIELLIGERTALLQVVGASAVLVANLDVDCLPEEHDTIEAAEYLAETLNALPEETLRDALEAVRAELDEEEPGERPVS